MTNVPPNGVIGILGGGQLGRMLALAAARLGLRSHIYDPKQNGPASQCATTSSSGAYDDQTSLTAFANSVDVITYEFENVPVQTVAFLQAIGKEVAPGRKPLATAQDRLEEKRFLNDIGATTAAFRPVDDLASLTTAINQIGTQSILKTRRFGYDGKGQISLSAYEQGRREAQQKTVAHVWDEVGQRPSILEGFVDFDFEISIIAARSRDGDVRCYPPSRNSHQNGILRTSTFPSGATDATILDAVDITKKILLALDYTGVIGVEFFVLKDGGLVVNEFAPRVHNSGHWTDHACAVSQFEQHIRAIAGWPLADPAPHSGAVMENLIGEDVNRWASLATFPHACINLYGKEEIRTGRKMGHVTHLKQRKAF